MEYGAAGSSDDPASFQRLGSMVDQMMGSGLLVKDDGPQVRVAAYTANLLGEGPCWAPDEERLYWFDIQNARLHWYELATGTTDGMALPMRASAAAVCSGGLIMATEIGLARFESARRHVSVIASIELGPGFRSNDGKIDPQGRFWWSSMDDNGGERPGALFVTTPSGRTERVLEGLHIANAIAFSAHGDLLYLADSRLGSIGLYRTADRVKLKTFAKPVGPGVPDGAAMDAEGYLWNAEWGAGRIVRYAPDGRVERIVSLPVEQPTSCAFGGPGLRTLFVTSARTGLSDAALAAQPLAGALFAFEPGVSGLPLPAFAA